MRRLSSNQLINWLAVLLSFSCLSTNDGNANEPAIVAAARQRQEVIKSIEVDIAITRWIATGGLTDLQGGAEFMKWKGIKHRMPKGETTIDRKERLILHGPKVRFEEKGLVWLASSGQFVQDDSLFVYDGRQRPKTYEANIAAPGSKPLPGGVLQEPNQPLDFASLNLAPLLLSIRGLDHSIRGLHVDNLKPADKTQLIAGEKCEEYFLPTKDNSLPVLFVWFSASKGDAPVRIQLNYSTGDVMSRMEIQQERSEVAGWFPVSWVIESYANKTGKLCETQKVIAKFLRANEGFADDLFEKQFPTGTQVADNESGSDLVVQSDGSLKVIRESPKKTIEPSAIGWPLLALSIVGVSVGVYLAVRRRIRRVKPRQDL